MYKRQNQILISEDTYLLVKNEIRCEISDEITVKGISHPVQTYNVVDTTTKDKETHSRFEEHIPGLSLDLDLSMVQDTESARNALSIALGRLGHKKG